MVTKYPAQIDDNASLPEVTDNSSPVQADVVNRLRAAIVASEAELGVKPSGTYSTVRARLDALEGILNGFDFIRLAQDLGGTTSLPKVIGLQGRPLSSALPNLFDTIMWNGIAWVPHAMSALFDASLSGGGIVEVSQTVTHPAFLANYVSGSPATAVLTDTDLNPSTNVILTPTSFSSPFSFTKNSFGESVAFTLTATQGAITKTPSVTWSWGQKLFWGVGPSDLGGSAFISTYSTGNATTLTRSYSFTVTAGETQKIYFACRSGYGSGTAVFYVGGFEGGITFKGTFSHTNDFGFIELYDLYESDFTGLGTTTVNVS